jgi:hypothetical protein
MQTDSEIRPLYDIFECLSNGSVKWLMDVSGLIRARRKLRELVESTGSEYFAVQTPTRAVIFHSEAPALGKRVLQIAYATELARQRAHLLRGLGYGVLSVVGNDAAKRLLPMLWPRDSDISFFMVGHAVRESTRKEIVEWLKAEYPLVDIVALNPPNQKILGADYNVLQNRPELWLRLLTIGAADPGCAATN